MRNGKESTAEVTIADRAKLFAARLGGEQQQGDEGQPQESKFGLTVKGITQDMANRYSLPNTKGVIVQDVKPDGFGDTAGLSRGDVILEINKQPVNNEDDYHRIETADEERSGRGLPGTAARQPRQQYRVHGRHAAVTRRYSGSFQRSNLQAIPAAALRHHRYLDARVAPVSFWEPGSFLLFP